MTRRPPFSLLLLASLILFTGASAWAGQRDAISFDADWKFQIGDVSGAEVPDYNDSGWRTLDVPHDWSIEGEYSKNNPMGGTAGYLPAGIGWYRKTFAVTDVMKGKYVEVAFDGVFMNSTVWANGKKLGTRPYGWISFSYDISEIVDSSDEITIAVRVDNEKQPAARWYTGSGIYGHTWLDIKNKVHIPHDGVFVRTTGNEVELDLELKNAGASDVIVGIKTVILDPNGDAVAEIKDSEPVGAGMTVTKNLETSVAKALRWSPETPQLYTAVSELWINGQAVNQMKTRFGIRDVEWIPETGMWLNGKNVKLQGVCNHQDGGALGAAVPDKILRFRIEQLKAMGCNAIRVSHNPQTPIFYEICDEVGMMVMDEIFDGWKKKAAHDYGRYHFNDWWRRDVTDWVRRDRNHPSIVIYSVGNETGGPVGKDLVELCHELDPTRPVTSGHSASNVMDVYGANGASERVGYLDTVKKDRVFIGTENTHTWQVRGYYRTKTWYRDGLKKGVHVTPDLTEEEVFTHDWIESDKRGHRKQVFNSSYDNATVRSNVRQNIEQIRDVPHFAGSFRWTGHDYIGEASYVHGGWPFRAFMGGAIDLANFEKDLYFLYQSQWTDEPMIHILPHWTHPKVKASTEIPVQVYSNCDTVELFFNGKSLGKQRPGVKWDEMQCQWMVPWQPGELKAVGVVAGRVVVDQTIRTADAPAQIALSIDGEPLAEEGKDLVQVRVTSQDSKGEFYPYGENRTYFKVTGPAWIRALDNGSPVDVEPHYGVNSRIAFYGLTRAYVASTGESGDIALIASSILGEKKQVTSNMVSIDAKVLALRGQPSAPNLEVFYTTDGSKPTKASTSYEGSFPVKLGTTVKALIVMNGEPVQVMEERFAMNEGFVWNTQPSNVRLGGDQAEDARLSGAKVVSKGKGYNGKGFVDFGHNKGAFVEWYQENDGDAGQAELVIRYSGKRPNKAGSYMQLSVNGKVVKDRLLLPNANGWGSDWKTVSVKIPIGRGANTIRLTTVESGGMYIDEIQVK